MPGLPTFVTGGTGFIGRTLVARLHEQGRPVHLLARKTSDLTGLTGEGVTIFYGDVTDRGSIEAAVAGCAAVYHLAGYARSWARDPAIYHQVNVQGFRNVAEAALAGGVERMVSTSTCMTFGPSDGEPITELMDRRADGFLTEYERTKYLAEVEAQDFVSRGLALVIVNPTRVYGPGRMTEGNSVTRMVRMCLRGRFPCIPGSGAEIGNYAYVDDVVDGHLKAMRNGKVGEKYILGGEDCSLNDFFLLLSRLSGMRPPRWHLPACLARLFARFEQAKAHVLGIRPMITPGWMETFLRDWAFSSEKARVELGYTARGLREGLALTCDWLTGNEADEGRAA